MAGSFYKDKNTEFAQSFNHYNLLARSSPKYIQIDYEDADEESDGSTTYYTDSYDRQGKYHEIDFNSDADLKDGQLLKLDTKGSYVRSYQKILPDDMPYKVYKIFQN